MKYKKEGAKDTPQKKDKNSTKKGTNNSDENIEYADLSEFTDGIKKIMKFNPNKQKKP